MSETSVLRQGQVLTGSLFNEPMRVETVRPNGPDTWVLGLVGIQSERFRSVTLTSEQIASLSVQETAWTYDGDGQLLRLGLQAYALGIAYEFDPYFGLSVSRVDPLPHQLEAIYDYLLKVARVRFLLADDAGAGKTIMAGLLIRELKLRGLAERILIVCPSNLTFQWQRELKDKFDEKFLILKGSSLREQFGVNQWLEQNHVITSLDLAKREDILPGLRQVNWDLVIVDEAHRMSASDPEHKTQRYRLGELLRDSCDHILLLTATPHKGDPENFTFFLQLLDEDAYADVRSIRQAMNQRRAPFYLRRTKEAMVYFPERRPDGSWVARKIFTKRIPHTVDFQMDGPEFELYREVTRFVRRESTKAAARGDDPRARAIGFLMSLYQRRLASSTYAMRHSLENRIRRLDEGLKRAQELVRLAPPDLPAALSDFAAQASLPDPDEFEEMEESERERLEEMLDAITLAGNAEQIREEIAELKQLGAQAKAVEDSGTLPAPHSGARQAGESKLSRLKDLLEREGFFRQPDKRLLIFTEFKDTLDYLVGRLKDWNFRVGFIHGSMRPGSRDEPRSRLYAEQQFKDGEIQVLVATEAAGEGINLQCCNILFNYDIPWNPNRLEQRMGRIHRYGQPFDCLIFNFVATNTIEGHVLPRLLEKLQEIRDALDDDAVFNVVGEVLPAAHVERVLRDFYSGRLGEADLEDRLLKNVDEKQFRAICQNALEGLAAKKLNLEMLIERRARAQERRVVPETIARFIGESSDYVPFTLKPAASLPHAFEGFRTPSVLRRFEPQPDWRLPPLAARYPRFSTDKETAEKSNLEWVTPGHPFFEALRRHALGQAQEAFSKGACFYSLQHSRPARLDFYRARVVDGLGNVIHERLFAVELRDDNEPRLQEPGILGNFLPAPRPKIFYVYVIECEDGSHYIGQTDNLQRRWEEHKAGKVEWTKGHIPVRIAHYEEFSSREEAVKRESDLKTGYGRKWLKDLIASGRARQAGTPADIPSKLPSTAALPDATTWLNQRALTPFLEDVRSERLSEVDRIAAHVELSLTELIQKADEEIGKAAADVEKKLQGAEGRLAQAEARHSELMERREKRRQDLERQRALSLQGVQRIASAIVLPHPEREAPDVRRLRPDAEVEEIAIQVVMQHEKERGCQVYDVHEKNLGYDVTSLDLNSGELRLIEVKGIGGATGTVLLTPNERRVAEDRRDCYWLYVVTNCKANPELQQPIKDPARFPWHEVKKVEHYYLSVDALTQPMRVKETSSRYAEEKS